MQVRVGQNDALPGGSRVLYKKAEERNNSIVVVVFFVGFEDLTNGVAAGPKDELRKPSSVLVGCQGYFLMAVFVRCRC